MSDVLISSGQTAHWQKLVSEAEALTGVALDEDLESYLVFTLMRYTRRPEMAARVLALDYLEAAQSAGSASREQMRDVGDQCLLLAGLFPRRARRRRVRLSYYVDLGRSAYQNVAESIAGMASLYTLLAGQFVQAMDTLQAIRRLGDQAQQLEPLDAFDLWQDTGSPGALATLQLSTDAISVASVPVGRKPYH